MVPKSLDVEGPVFLKSQKGLQVKTSSCGACHAGGRHVYHDHDHDHKRAAVEGKRIPAQLSDVPVMVVPVALIVRLFYPVRHDQARFPGIEGSNQSQRLGDPS